MRNTSLCLFAFMLLVLSSMHVEPSELKAKPAILKAWNNFLKAYGKKYSTAAERSKRFDIFVDNFQFITDQNEKANGTFELAVNSLADLTQVEFKKFYLGTKVPVNFTRPANVLAEVNSLEQQQQMPANLDHSGKYAKPGSRGILVNPIQNQQNCGSCWAFTVAAVLESGYKMKTGSLLKFSEQDLVDCDKKSLGCDGGWPHETLVHAKNNGVSLLSSYPYTAKQSTCQRKTPRYNPVGFRGTQKFTAPSKIMADLNLYGVHATVMDASSRTLQFYKQGVLTREAMKCSAIDHAVNLVGYVTTGADAPYWIFRNSWGAEWGDAGYFRIRMYPDPINYCFFQEYLWNAYF